MKGYGITNINLGYIESLSVTRGGEDTTYNKWRQPLSVNVSLSVRPAAEGFAMVSSKSDIVDVANIGDAMDDDSDLVGPLGPAFTTVGTLINSFRPIPEDISNMTANLLARAGSSTDLDFNGTKDRI